VYKYLPNKELRSAISLDVSQDVIKNQHKNKAKTNPKQTQTKPICKMLKMNVSSAKTDDYGKTPAFCRMKNKAKTKPIRLRLWLRRDRFKANFNLPARPVQKYAGSTGQHKRQISCY